MRHDPYFGTPTGISRGCAPVNPLDGAVAPEEVLLQDRAEAIWSAAYGVRTALFSAYERQHGEACDLLPLSEQTDLLLAAFCERRNRLKFYLNPELETAISRFRQLVPLIPFTAIEALASAPIDVSPNEVRTLLRDRSEGRLGPEELQGKAQALARLAGVEFNLEADPVAETAALVDRIEAQRKLGPCWKQIFDGTESRVYFSETNQTVYKALPFRGELLHVKPILGDEEIDVGNAHGTYLADPHGGMPLFDRARLMARVPGLCRTELVAISASGLALYKQPYLGWEEPTPDALAEWAREYGHAALPEQSINHEDVAMIDATRAPFVTASPTTGTYVMAMDINPRNARRWNGQAIPFDPVLRELQPEEIASHPALQAAVQAIDRRHRRRDRSLDI
ncbi:MAG: hypothetical protein PHE83_18190 [Opitutaceae bacterium]|nr:hypothetical protein [Opitutaceae bacterium]